MDNAIWEIIGKKLKHEADGEESKILETWLSENADNQEVYSEIERVWERTGVLTRTKPINLDQEWDAFKEYRDKQDSGKSEYASKTNSKVIALNSNWFYRIAAILVLGLGLGYFSGYRPFGISEEAELITYYSGNDKLDIVLPDGSQVWLNQETRVSYSEGFGNEHRTLELNGEAFFDVMKSDIRFRIKGSETVTEVLGTSFNVKEITGEVPEVIVVRGKVAFSALNDLKDSVVLIPGDRAILDDNKNGIVKTKNTDLNFIAWKDQVLTFDATELRTVISTLEKYFNVRIKLKNENILGCHFTGKFTNPKLNEVLDVIAASMNLEYRLEGELVFISGEGCL